MRILVLLKYGEHYVADKLDPPGEWGHRFIRAHLAVGGEVMVPVENLAAVEHYGDDQIETFRQRLKAVEASNG